LYVWRKERRWVVVWVKAEREWKCAPVLRRRRSGVCVCKI
jgi:hypothetical protein